MGLVSQLSKWPLNLKLFLSLVGLCTDPYAVIPIYGKGHKVGVRGKNAVILKCRKVTVKMLKEDMDIHIKTNGRGPWPIYERNYDGC